MPAIAKSLGAVADIPEHADVANAVGAITSDVVLTKNAYVMPSASGNYVVRGLVTTNTFPEFEEAFKFAVDNVHKDLLQKAKAFGAGKVSVQVDYFDKTAKSADGTRLFIERQVTGSLSGMPIIT